MKKTLLIIAALSSIIFAGCQSAAPTTTTQTPSTQAEATSKAELTISSQEQPESKDITKSNLENSLSELDLVE